MARINIDFTWPVGSEYKIVRPSPAEIDDSFAAIREPCILQVGPAQYERRPLDNGKLHLQFADLSKAPDFDRACLGFARAFGLPTQRAEDGAKERLSNWRALVERMTESMEGLRRAQEENALPSIGAAITEIEVRLLPGQDGRATLSLRPQRLWDAMRLQLGQSIAGDRELATCPNCNRWFEVGGRGAGVKRARAIFCEPKCKNEFNYRKRAS